MGTKNIPVGQPSSQSKFEANRSKSSRVMIGHTNKDFYFNMDIELRYQILPF